MKKELPIVSVSGGKDSTALYLLAIEQYGKDGFVPVFADTDHEHPVTVNYVKNMHIMANGPEVNIVNADFERKIIDKRFRLLQKHYQEGGCDLRKINKLIPTGKAFADLIIWKSRVPSTKAQFCTEHLKLWPILFFLEKKYPKEKYEWIMFTGIRGQESANRAKKQPFMHNGFFDCLSILPLLYEIENTVWELLKKYEMPPNPLYALGFKRVGCFPCIHSRKSELNLLPDWAWDKLQYYENLIDKTWFPPDILPKSFKAEKDELPTIEKVRDWSKTLRGGKRYGLFESKENVDAPSCMTGFVICE